MTISEMIGHVAQLAPLTSCGNDSIAPNGIPYLKMINGDIVGKGELIPRLFANPQDAMGAFLDGFRRYVEVNAGKALHWRDWPELEHGGGGWRVRARFVAA